MALRGVVFVSIAIELRMATSNDQQKLVLHVQYVIGGLVTRRIWPLKRWNNRYSKAKEWGRSYHLVPGGCVLLPRLDMVSHVCN